MTLGNAYTRIVFRTGENDARKLADGFSFFEAKDIHELGRGEALVRMGSGAHDFNLKTFPAKEIQEDEAQARRAAIVALSRGRYAVSAEVLKAKLREQYGSKEEVTPEAPSSQVPNAPTPSPADRVSGLSPPETRDTSKKPNASKVRLEVPPPLGRGGQEHKYLQHLVKRLAEERGFRANIEEVAGDGRADVVLVKEKLRIACEVSITTDPEHEAENLMKCQAAGFDQIVFLVPDKKRRAKLCERFKEMSGTVPISVIGTDDLVATLDGLDVGSTTTESTVRGYKVKVTRQTLSPDDMTRRRSTISAVIARSLSRGKLSPK